MSKKLSLNLKDLQKIAKGAAMAFIGASLIQINIFLSTGVVFDWRVWAVSIASTGVNAAWKFITKTN